MSASTTHTLRVLHLSDLHERVAVDGEREDPRKLKIRLGRAKRYRVLGPELTKRLDAIVKERRPDLLVFTGDLADWGLHEEYVEAEKRLDEVVKRLGLTWDRVFFVPGNHDVQRKTDESCWAEMRLFAADHNRRDALSRWLAGDKPPLGAPTSGLDLPAKRQSGYRGFLERVKRPELLPDGSRGHPRLGYRQTLALPGLPPVHIIGLDTAWLAGDDNDQGKLLLTEHQVLLNATNPDDGAPLTGLRLALMHHPLSDLGDAADAHRLLSDNVDLVLHGHQHTADAHTASNPNHTLRTLAAGSVYEGDEEDKWVNSFHTIDVEMNAEGEPLRYVVQFYAWAPVGGHWHPHAALYRDVPDGRLIWETPLGQAQPRPVVAVAPPPADALAKFIGRAEQLAALSAALLPPTGQAQAAVVCNLQGMAGVGKSFLVERFYADLQARFPGGHLKITLGHDAAPTADTLLSELAERLGVLQGPGRVEDRVGGAASAARPLLHIDNLDAEAQAQAAVALVRRLPGVPIVLSGRYHFGRATSGWRLVPVAPFSVSDALAQLQAELVAEVAARVNDADRLTLVGALGGLPLAIHLAASYLNAGYEVRDFLAELEASGLSLTPFTASDTAYLDRAERALQATFELSLKALRVDLGAEADAGLPAVAALGVAPLSGVGRAWLEAIVGAPSGKGIRWVSLAVKLGLVQHDPTSGRWRVHKLLAEHLRQHTDADAATAQMDAWVMERLPAAPDDTRGARWGALQAEHEAVAEWVAGLDGARAVVGGLWGYDYARTSGPYAAWLGALARGLVGSDDPDIRSRLLWRQGNLARQAGDLDLAYRAAEAKGAHDAARGQDREVALAAGLRADILQARGQLDEALRIRRDEVLPVYERLGDARSKAVTMGQIADIHEARGQLDEALRIRRDEVLPIYERLGDVRSKAVTMGKIADILQARGQLDEALRIRRDEVLPVYEALGARHNLLIGQANLAITLLRTQRPEHIPEALTLLTTALQSAVDLNFPVEAEQLRGLFRQLGLPPPR
ncbi:metallophosphoesterase [Myxococcota bacterium]|nr:metallophosphoesterase [Myxococcota bacterium]